MADASFFGGSARRTTPSGHNTEILMIMTCRLINGNSNEGEEVELMKLIFKCGASEAA